MSIYCWGNTAHGELGLGGIEEEQIPVPRVLDWSGSPDIAEISCGMMHTLMLTGIGQVYSCGCNDYGQLGHELSRKRPQLVNGLENYTINQVSCGAAHSVAINEWGQCFTWGSNSRGQLAKDVLESMNVTPKLVKGLATKNVVQIASGMYHSLALTNGGDLYSWGSNTYGQLGIGYCSEMVSQPTIINSLLGVPIAFIACGGNHSFAVTKSGAVYGWGKNVFGQLGVNDDKNRSCPTHLRTMRNLGVRYIACGDDFTVFLTSDGGVFTCGFGNFGQLGHGSTNNVFLPRMIVELMGTTCTQIACGGRHTLTFVPSRGRVYAFGLGGSGQLGNRASSSAASPQVVMGPWLSPSGQCLVNESTDTIVRKIFSGGDHSFVSAVQSKSKSDKDLGPIDCRIWRKNAQILGFSKKIAETCARVAADDVVDQELMTLLETVFKSQACLNASFLMVDSGNRCCSSKCSNVNMIEAEEAFEHVRKIEHETLKLIIWDGITSDIIPNLATQPPDIETLRVYLTLPFYHEFSNTKNYPKLQGPFGRAFLRLTEIPNKIVCTWWDNEPVEYFERLVDIFKDVALHIIQFDLHLDSSRPIYVASGSHLELVLKVMRVLYRLNRGKAKVEFARFHLTDLSEMLNLQQDYIMWLMNRNAKFLYLCDYPFLFDAKAKTLLLQTDQAIQMRSAMDDALTQTFLSFGMDPAMQFIVLNVTRHNLVQDTLRELTQYGSNDLKKPLKIKFEGEEAEDAGGVRKEFFMLLLKDLLDPKYGMFKEEPDSRAIWFSELTFEDNLMYMLIGSLCGLAIYNFTIINLPFPLALYKKLLRTSVNLSDLRDLSPMVANSLQSLLDYEGDDFENVFDLTFVLSREVFGEAQTIPLKPNGENIAVTQQNKAEYVDLYIDYVLNVSVLRQFQGFSDGFMKVCGGKVMELFEPHELMAVVVGNEDYDWHVFEEQSEYKNGYTSGDPTIRWFWEVFHELPLSEKKKFLLFLTGSDRIPIQGMKAIKIIFQPTTDEKFLPVAHTCFNLLDLPRYQTKERLKYKLTQAIQQTLGFSLV